MTQPQFGFGVAAAIDPAFIAPLAKAAEEHGFATFWVNDTPGADGLEALALAAAATSMIRLGVGVIPVDRRNGAAIGTDVVRLNLPTERLIVGIGSGSTRTGSLALMTEEIEILKSMISSPVVVGALGPKMIAVGSSVGDGVLLNWLTPAWAKVSRDLALASSTEGTVPEVIGYVRVATPEGNERVELEAARYASIPQYGAHFDRMGVSALGTCVVGDRTNVQPTLNEYAAVLDETVVRALVGDESLANYLSVMETASPERA